tara:strand:+ start:1625 stop:2359 length:735 start_codon:yes stop_codon:yes gene_type:complete
MKRLILLSALFIFACSSDLFAQDYMKMKKKQLRIEHQKKLKLIDSLSQQLSLSNNENQKIQSDSKLAKGQFEVKLLNYKGESDQLNLELNQLNVRTEYLEIELSKSNKTISELKSKVTNLEADLKGKLLSKNNLDIIATWEGSWIRSDENCDPDSKGFVSIGKTNAEVVEDDFWKKNTWYLSGYEERFLISGIAVKKNSLEITTSSLQHYGGIIRSEMVLILGISSSGELIHPQFGRLSNCSEE